MQIKKRTIKVVEKVEGWMLTLLGLIFALFATIGGFFFKNFYSRLDKVEDRVTELKGRVDSFKETLKAQQDQNTREHDNLGKGIDIMREAQSEMFKDIKDLLKNDRRNNL